MFKNNCLIALITFEDFCNKVLVTIVIEVRVRPLDYLSPKGLSTTTTRHCNSADGSAVVTGHRRSTDAHKACFTC